MRTIINWTIAYICSDFSLTSNRIQLDNCVLLKFWLIIICVFEISKLESTYCICQCQSKCNQCLWCQWFWDACSRKNRKQWKIQSHNNIYNSLIIYIHSQFFVFMVYIKRYASQLVVLVATMRFTVLIIFRNNFMPCEISWRTFPLWRIYIIFNWKSANLLKWCFQFCKEFVKYLRLLLLINFQDIAQIYLVQMFALSLWTLFWLLSIFCFIFITHLRFSLRNEISMRRCLTFIHSNLI